MKSKYITLSIALCSILGVSSCDSYLDINPKQVLDQNILNKPSDIEGFVTAAYARMCEMGSLDSSPYMYWWSGSMRSDDCYKGGGGVDLCFAADTDVVWMVIYHAASGK